MKPEMILQADVLDIVFENRNKEYGAYALRKEYAQRLFRSLGGVVFILLAGFVFLFSKNNNPRYNSNIIPVPFDSGVTLRQYELPKPPPQKLPPATLPPVRTIADPPPIIVPDTEETDTIPTIEDKSNAVISNKTIAGPPAGTENVVPPIEQPGNGGNGTEKNEQPVIVEPVVLNAADVMPEFPGGVAAWQRFLQKNLRFPDEGADNEEDRKIVVTVRFVVNEDGTLTGLEIMQSGGKEFDKEVLRVMNKSPKWVAGSNKGRKVKVFHKQPVIFVYEVDK